MLSERFFILFSSFLYFRSPFLMKMRCKYCVSHVSVLLFEILHCCWTGARLAPHTKYANSMKLVWSLVIESYTASLAWDARARWIPLAAAAESRTLYFAIWLLGLVNSINIRWGWFSRWKIVKTFVFSLAAVVGGRGVSMPVIETHH